jgi:hypothetical protein
LAVSPADFVVSTDYVAQVIARCLSDEFEVVYEYGDSKIDWTIGVRTEMIL